MASKKETRYTFKGNNKKVDNKYANIYEDLSNKDKIYEENSLKKIHKDDKEEVDKKIEPILREVSPEEAEKNAKKRKQAMLNEKQIAIQKSNPVVNHAISQSYDRIESIERLKREKEASKLDNSLDDPEYIKYKAKQRASMDKSDVEIYKEYSDFDRSDISMDSLDDKDSDRLDLTSDQVGENNRDLDYDDFKTKKIENIMETLAKREESRPTEPIPRVTQGIKKLKQSELYDYVRLKESEIEELIKKRRKQEKLETSSMTRSERKQARKLAKENKMDTTTSNPNTAYRNRLDVYKNNSKNTSGRINIKKVFITVIGLFLSLVVVATGIDMLRHNLANTSTTNKSTVSVNKRTSQTKANTKTASTKTPSKEEKIKKLEAIKGKLNSQEVERLDYIIKNIDSYPSNLIDLVLRNYETVDFVYSYKDRDKYNDKKLSSDISSSYHVDGDLPLFLQWDRRWGYRTYGKELLGLAGCGPTSLAMVVRYFDPNLSVNPYDVAKYSQDNGYISKDNFTSWKLFETGLAKYNLESQDIIPVEAKMKRALDENKILIVSVKPGIFTERGHIIVIKGYNKNGDFLINDPNSIVNTNKSWSFDELKGEIRKIWAVSSNNSKSSSRSNSKEDDTKTSSKNESSNSENSSNANEDASIIQDID